MCDNLASYQFAKNTKQTKMFGIIRYMVKNYTSKKDDINWWRFYFILFLFIYLFSFIFISGG